MEQTYDVVIIGGGPAGLAGALALGRSRRSVLVIDSAEPRNAPAGHVHNYLGREGMPPAELLAIGRSEVAQYGVEIETGTVTKAAPTTSGFTVHVEDGRQVLARRLLVTTGLVDELPDLPGLAEAWGQTVLHCPYCHGWEVRDQAVGVLATSPFGIHQALLFRQLTDDVTYFVHTAAPSTDEELDQLSARGVKIVEGPVSAWEDGGVRLQSGELVPRQVLVVSPVFAARGAWLESLGLETTPVEMAGHVIGTRIAADPTGLTAVPGVWVAGNVTDVRAQVISSAAAGLGAGAMINADLVAEEARLAVEHLRASATS